MSNLVFPVLPGQALPVQRSAIWKNRVVEADSGKRYSRAVWSYPRWVYRLRFDVLRAGAEQEIQTLLGFFNRHGGDADTWLFSDPSDRTAIDQQLGVTDGVQTQWQLLRSMGGHTEPVLELDGAPEVRVDGVVQAVTFNAHTGVITFASAPTAGGALTWSGNFYWRCRFDKSQQDVEMFLQDLWSGSVTFSTEK